MRHLALTYSVDFNHLFEASSLMAKRRYPAGLRRTLYAVHIGGMVAGGVLAVFGGVLINRLYPDISAWSVTIILLGLLAIVYAKVVLPWTARLSASAIADKRVAGPMQFLTDDQGMRWVDADIDFRLNWSGVEAIYCTSGAFAFMSGALALVLPYSAFPNAAAGRSFLTQALEAIPAEAAALSLADRSIQAVLKP